jgi:GrpB-like predicted nucleotidyltransferase (UPF0157 family)
MAAAIEHVGSAEIPDLAAKPIIDIDVLLASETMLPGPIDRLASLSYVHRGTLGVPEREAFPCTRERSSPSPLRLSTMQRRISNFEGTWRSRITSALIPRKPNSAST